MNRMNMNRLNFKFPKFLTTSAPKQQLVLEPLISRALIRVKGFECSEFLQGLITNDINHLSRHTNAMYTMFLNKQGRVLYDSIIYKTINENMFYVECDKLISEELIKHLKLFRVRRKINIDLVDDEIKIWSAYNPNLEFNYDQFNLEKLSISCYVDPRVKSLGLRILTEIYNNVSFIKGQLDDIHLKEGNNYKEIRYKFGITEGVAELPPGKCFPLESNCDYLHGVSFHKGCYIGQELTARTHHTGVVRKRIMPIRLAESVPFADKLSLLDSENKPLGVIRGIQNTKAIGLLRIDQAIGANVLHIDGVVCKTERPKWWPKEEIVLEK